MSSSREFSSTSPISLVDLPLDVLAEIAFLLADSFNQKYLANLVQVCRFFASNLSRTAPFMADHAGRVALKTNNFDLLFWQYRIRESRDALLAHLMVDRRVVLFRQVQVGFAPSDPFLFWDTVAKSDANAEDLVFFTSLMDVTLDNDWIWKSIAKYGTFEQIQFFLDPTDPRARPYVIKHDLTLGVPACLFEVREFVTRAVQNPRFRRNGSLIEALVEIRARWPFRATFDILEAVVLLGALESIKYLTTSCALSFKELVPILNDPEKREVAAKLDLPLRNFPSTLLKCGHLDIVRYFVEEHGLVWNQWHSLDRGSVMRENNVDIFEYLLDRFPALLNRAVLMVEAATVKRTLQSNSGLPSTDLSFAKILFGKYGAEISNECLLSALKGLHFDFLDWAGEMRMRPYEPEELQAIIIANQSEILNYYEIWSRYFQVPIPDEILDIETPIEVAKWLNKRILAANFDSMFTPSFIRKLIVGLEKSWWALEWTLSYLASAEFIIRPDDLIHFILHIDRKFLPLAITEPHNSSLYCYLFRDSKASLRPYPLVKELFDLADGMANEAEQAYVLQVLNVLKLARPSSQ